MKYSESLISTPFPINFFELGNSSVVEWSAVPSENPRNELLFKKLNYTSGQDKKLLSVISNDCFFDNEHIAEPALFIFHVSRCGSTLAANYFASDFQNRVFNEPAILSKLFTKRKEKKVNNNHLRAVIRCLGMGTEHQNKLIIKFSSSHIEHLDWIHSVYPNVPKIMICRQPKEVLVSLFENPPRYLLGKDKEAAAGEFFLNNCASHLKKVYSQIVENGHLFSKKIDYKNLKNELINIESELWGNSSRKDNMNPEYIFKHNSKNTALEFKDDVFEKRNKWEKYRPLIGGRTKELEELYSLAIPKD